MVFDIVAESVVCNVLIDDENVVGGVDIVVVTEKDLDDNNRFNIVVDVVLECASEECDSGDEN